MELYIEKEFLYKFNKKYINKPVQKIVKEIFIEYGSKRVFVDYNTEDFKKLEEENSFFDLISNIIPPTSVDSINQHLFSNSDFKQTLVFANNKEDWFEKAEYNGALCFSFDNYQEKIEEIIDKLHFEIDLSETFQGWFFLNNYSNLKYHLLFFVL